MTELDDLPKDVLIQTLSSLSDKDLLDLHGKSKDLKNWGLRKATEQAMRQRIRKMLGSRLMKLNVCLVL